jgi:hypothetical protein
VKRCSKKDTFSLFCGVGGNLLEHIEGVLEVMKEIVKSKKDT